MPMKMDKTIPAEEQARRTRKYTNMLVILAIMIVVSLVSCLHQNHVVGFDWTETQVTVTDPAENSFTVVYADLTSVTLETVSGYGTCLDGGKAEGFYYGQWENDQWGRYTLCASTQTDCCIVMRSAENTYVISYESDEITESLYESIRSFLPQ